MNELTSDYKEQYEVIFQADLALSEKLKPKMIEILNKVKLPKKFKDNIGTKNDFMGRDLTVKPLQIGLRARRLYSQEYDQFTEDDKERDTMSCDIYFYGYANEAENDLISYVIFDHNDFRFAREKGLIRFERCKQDKHSLVPFTAYYIWDIIKNCRVYYINGDIGWKKPSNKGVFSG